jgi:hypothetical protein
MITEGDLAPDSFVNPSLPLYVMLPPLGLQQRLASAGALSGRAADPLLLGRALAALAGAAAVVVLGATVRATQPALGPWPALLLALWPGFVNLCHFATPEAWLFLGTAATLFAAVAHQRGGWPAWALGLVLGLTASTKYTAAALAVPALLAVALRDPAGPSEASPADPSKASPVPRRSAAVVLAAALLILAGVLLVTGPGLALALRLHLRDARLLHPEEARRFVRGLGLSTLFLGWALLGLWALARAGHRWAARLVRPDVLLLGLAAAAGFLAGTPYAALQPLRFLSDLAFNAQTRHEYKGLTGVSTSFLPYLALFVAGITLPGAAAAALGGLAAAGRALRGEALAVLLLAATVAPYLLVASSGHQALRFLAPALPPAAWLAALGVFVLPQRGWRITTLGLIAARAALGALLVVRLFFADSRQLATRWLEAHVPVGATVDVISNVPNYLPRPPQGRTFRVVPTLSREMAPPDRFREAARRYPAEASEWLLLTAAYYERFLDHPEQTPERAVFFRDLLEDRGGFEVMARFRQQGWRRPPVEFLDPEIVILRRHPDAPGP